MPIGERVSILIQACEWVAVLIYLLDALVGGLRSALRRR